MTRVDILQKLNEIFCDVFDEDDLVLREEMTSDDIDGWDSLTQISILATAEGEFKIKLAISDTRHLKNIGALVDLIEQKIN